MHAASFFFTATISPEHLGPLASVSKRDAQLLIKRIRRHVEREHQALIRFDLVAEYSPRKMRPHYHGAIFGWWPPDAVFRHNSRAGHREYSSEILTRLWGKGIITIQAFTPGAAGYIAGHQASKLTRRLSEDSLVFRDDSGAVLGFREPEFRLCSRRPGIGAGFYERHGHQLRALDFTVIDGAKRGIPRYYDKLSERVDPDGHAERVAARELASMARREDGLPERLAVREEVAKARQRFRSRSALDG